MPIQRDNEAERNERIEKILNEIRETQKRVEQHAAEGRARAQQLAAERHLKVNESDPSTATSKRR